MSSTVKPTENLYLLEFLVNDVNLDGAGKCDCSRNELCVYFQFLNNQELQVCERDFDQDKKLNKAFRKSGKSCIFSLTPKELDDALKKFDVCVSVHKKPPPEEPAENKQPPKKAKGKARKKGSKKKLKSEEPAEPAKDDIIGGTIISADALLADLIEDNTSSSPSAKILEDRYPLEKQGNKVGTIDIYIRLSCYGKMIVTQFQMNIRDKTVLFQDKAGRSLYRYTRRQIQPNTNTAEASGCPQTPCFPEGRPENFSGPPPCAVDPAGGANQDQTCPTTPCFPGGRPENFSGPPPCAVDTAGGGNQDQTCPTTPCFPGGRPDNFSGPPPCGYNPMGPAGGGYPGPPQFNPPGPYGFGMQQSAPPPQQFYCPPSMYPFPWLRPPNAGGFMPPAPSGGCKGCSGGGNSKPSGSSPSGGCGGCCGRNC